MGSSPAPLSDNNQNAAETRWGTQKVAVGVLLDRLCVARARFARRERPCCKASRGPREGSPLTDRRFSGWRCLELALKVCCSRL